MRDGYRIIDADRHVVEPIEMWREHLAPELSAHAPYLSQAGGPGSPLQPMVDGKSLYHRMSSRAIVELAEAGRRLRQRHGPLERPETQIAEMNQNGIDVAFLYPTTGLFLLGLAPLESCLAAGFVRAYNTWLRSFCDYDPERLKGVALVSLHDPERMPAELDHAAELGFRAVVLRPNPVLGRTLGDPVYEAFWAGCERLSIAVAIHEGAHAYLPTAGADRFHSRFALHACSHPMEQMMALLALVEGGVLDRHPGLRVAFLEAGCGWLPYWLHRLDEVEYRYLASEVKETVRFKPSTYFRRQCFVGFEPDEPYLPEAAARIGEDTLLFGTDFPHPDHDCGIVAQALALARTLPETVLRKLLADNAARFYGLDDSAAEHHVTAIV